MQGVRITGCSPELLPGCLAFAREQFGRAAYQASPRYMDWMFASNPFSSGLAADCLLGVTDENKVVGCVHRMRVPWQIDNQRVLVPALPNLMVAPEHRTGLGMQLILRAMRNEPWAFVLGCTDPLAWIYRRLGCHQVDARWYRRVLSPVRLGVQVGWHRLTGRTVRGQFITGACDRQPVGDGWLTTRPDEATLNRLSTLLRQRDGEKPGPDYSPEFLRWRFFHPDGPQHAALLLDRTDGTLDGALLLSLGPRKGTNIARIVTIEASTGRHFRTLIRMAAREAQRRGATMLLGYSASSKLHDWYASAGWQPLADGPQTYLYRKERGQPPVVSFTGEAGDLGFEAIPAAA